MQAPSEFGLGELLCSCGFVPWSCWSVLGMFGVVLLGFVKVSSSLQVVFRRWFLFHGLDESLRLPGTFDV
jgi:hypothetical protein